MSRFYLNGDEQREYEKGRDDERYSRYDYNHVELSSKAKDVAYFAGRREEKLAEERRREEREREEVEQRRAERRSHARRAEEEAEHYRMMEQEEVK
jgi:hypothetical protein